MKQESESQQQESINTIDNIAIDSTKIDKMLERLDLSTLNKVFLEQDFAESSVLSVKSNVPLQKAVYITEIDDEFYLLDHTGTIEEKPVPLAGVKKNQPQTFSQGNGKSAANSEKNPVFSSSFLSGRKGLFWGLGLGILVTFGFNRLFLTPTTTANNGASEPNLTTVSVPAQTVTVTEIEVADITNQLDASGTVVAYERTPVMSQASGLQVIEVLTERGDFVRRGQVLAKLNNRAILAQKTEAQGAVAQAQARLDELQAGSRVEEIAQAQARVDNAKSAIAQAESDLDLIQKRVETNRNLQLEGAITRDRLDELLNQEQVSKFELNRAKSNLAEANQALAQLKAGSRPQTIAQAQAELTQAQGRLAGIEAQLADTTIIAPQSGVIASRDAKVGQITSTSEMLFSIIKNGRLELRLNIPETLVNQVQVGQQVQISSNSNRKLNLTGKVREIEPTIDDSSRQATVKVDLPSGTNLKPGMFLQAAIGTSTEQGQAVPIEALLPQSGNQATAFVVQEDNTVAAKTVTMGEILLGQKVEVIDGLNPGDLLVLKGAAYLKDGDTVKIAQN